MKPSDIIKYAMAIAIVYNLIVVPVAAAFGLVLPTLLVNEAVQLLTTIGAAGG
ncbi:hypothetical protein [Serratia marcescens]|uniref:hypothetical protein n=1 Tax=Serratia marcescens TaxID=615 RepID=UPI001F153A57|nr:hypothetical protein [Serratia marcescens]MDP8728372.1 hypothetical protein [Serratia marcescens]